ncbi:glutamate ABC transporter substrate-binding protein [Streptomyces aurantiacus]|uniref:glutamate ABC transporter substrate-binding protein n=1 Tax=Streptomyces aurantiacus TaxID=47760 RepID=UPI0006E1F09F|nr:glutamate ABC transporter substrate-binding protein [Streptomyces aurantiacus]
MNARRMRASLRGWGGVGAMAVVCALAAVFALLLPRTQPGGADGPTGGRGAAQGDQARAEACEKPEERSLAPSSGDLDGAAVQKIRKRGKLVVGVDQNSLGWGYRDPNSASNGSGSKDSASNGSDLKGFDIDLARAIAKDILGDETQIIFRAVPTDQRIPKIQEGKVDMVVRTMTIDCDRLKLVSFSSPYFQTGQQVLAPKGSGITGYDDGSLAGKRVCSAKGSTALEHLEADKADGTLPASTNIRTTVPNQLDCLVRLQLGEVDAVVTDGALAASQAAQDPTVQVVGEPFTDEFYGVAMKKDGADDLIRRVNQILEDYRKNGWQTSYDDHLKKYLGASSGPPEVAYK